MNIDTPAPSQRKLQVQSGADCLAAGAFERISAKVNNKTEHTVAQLSDWRMYTSAWSSTARLQSEKLLCKSQRALIVRTTDSKQKAGGEN